MGGAIVLLSAGVGLFVMGFLLTIVLAFFFIKVMFWFNRVGVDVHKPCRVVVAESVGLALLMSMLLLSPIVYILGFGREALAFSLSTLIAGLIGLIDDFIVLRAWAKILLGVLPSIPVILLGVYEPKPLIPFDGIARLTIIYPLVLPIVYTVATNGFNMYDTHNGVMLIGASLMLVSMVVGGYIQYASGFEKSMLAVLLGFLVLGSVLGMLYYNIFPARAFNGDVGSFTLGAAIASIAVMGRVEAIALIAGLPIALNGFLKISSIGFKERRGFQRPVEIDGWLIKPRLSRGAPMSLTVLLTSRKPLSEPEIIIISTWLMWLSSLLSLITVYITLARLT